MIYSALAAILVHYCVFLLYYQKLFPCPGLRWLRISLALAVIGAAYSVLMLWGLTWLNIPVTLLMMFLGLRFSTSMSWLQALYGGGTCVLSAYGFRGILTSIVAALMLKSRPAFFMSSESYYLMTIVVVPLALLFFQGLRKTIFLDDRLMRFMKNTSQLRIVVAYEVTAALNFTVVNHGRFFPLHISWFIGITLGASILTLAMLIYSIHYSIRAVELAEYKWRSQLFEEQLDRQVRHYKAYQQYTESFRAFRHDYKSMAASLKTLIHNRHNQEAVRLLDSISDTMEASVKMHKKYADHVVLDAILQDLADQCQEQQIRFDIYVSAPRDTALSTVEAVRIFSNLANNAVEACCKLPVEQRFLEITSANAAGWATLQVTNAYNGETVRKDGVFKTTKEDAENHGYGTAIVKEIAEKVGGFVVFEAHPQKKQFVSKVHIPRQTKQDH